MKKVADLMNDWEIGGTQNPWVCPSDRHLQLRAQLKSGWSVRTASARSPTTAPSTSAGKQSLGTAISDSEQEQIRRVLERAEAGRLNEQNRIGKMVDRLEKLRKRATGNGVTQCLLCQTEFGLLASKSYAAMCSDCRKYVCQRNCGVETFDQKRGEPVFLCKICSEYREVMWKKSGAWFYKEIPTYVKPFDSAGRDSSLPIANGTGFYGGGGAGGGDGPGNEDDPQPHRSSSPRYGLGNNHSNNNASATGRRSGDAGGSGSGRRSASSHPHTNHTVGAAADTFGAMSMYDGPPATSTSTSSYAHHHQSPHQSRQMMPFQVGPNAQGLHHSSFHTTSHSSNRQVPILSDVQQRLKTITTTTIAPRPRITPSWVHEKVQSSISIGSEYEEEEEEEEMGGIGSSSSSLDASAAAATEFRRKQHHPSSSAGGGGGGGGSSSGGGSGPPMAGASPRPTGPDATPQQQRRHHHHHGHHGHSRPKDLSSHRQHSTASSNRRGGGEPWESKGSLQRIVLSSRSRATDTEESENDESRRTTPSTSPRHSIATPSSYGGDDLSQNPAADSKSIDSGVVQSDHSAQAQQAALLLSSSGGGGVFPMGSHYHTSPPPPNRGSLNNSLSTLHSHQYLQGVAEEGTSGGGGDRTCSPHHHHQPPPPIPPRSSIGGSGSSARSSQGSSTTALGPHQHHSHQRPSSASSTPLGLGHQQGSGSKDGRHSASASARPPSSHDTLHMAHVAAAAMIQQRHANSGGGGGRDSRPDSSHSSMADLQMQSVYSGDFGGGGGDSHMHQHQSRGNVLENLRKRSAQFRTLNEGPIGIGMMEEGRMVTALPAGATGISGNAAAVAPSPTITSADTHPQHHKDSAIESPSFMSSPEDDPNIHCPNKGNGVRQSGQSSGITRRRTCHKTLSSNYPSSPQQLHYLKPMGGARKQLMKPALSVESDDGEIRAISADELDTIVGVVMDGRAASPNKRPSSAAAVLTGAATGATVNGSGGGGGGLETIDELGTLGSISLNLTYLPEEKQLVIHLIRAKNLKAMDSNGFSDPYVKFHLLPGNAKATKLTSKTIEKTLNPEWHEEMIYYGITEEERLRKTLRITVLDRDRIGSDFLGETRIALKKLPLGATKKFNLYLEHAMPIPPVEKEEEERGKLLVATQYNIQQGCLNVTIKRCAELLGMDSTGFSDPFVKVSLTPLASKGHRQKTSTKKRTLNPEFNETLSFIIPFRDLPKKTLEIGVFDHDVAKADDYIGGVILSCSAPGERGRQWQQCIENPGKTFEYWHRLLID